MNPIKPAALSTQEGGAHYAQMPIGPMEFAMANRWDPCAYNILKYISRHGQKNGVADLKKALHCVDLRVELVDFLHQEPVPVAISMFDYLTKNTIGVAEAAALKALDAWVWSNANRHKHQLIVALDVLIKRYNPAPAFGSLGSWPGDRLKTTSSPRPFGK